MYVLTSNLVVSESHLEQIPVVSASSLGADAKEEVLGN